MNSTLTNSETAYKATETYKVFNALYPHIDLSPFYGVQYGEVPPRDNNDDEEEVIEVDEVEGEQHDPNGEDDHDAGVQVENVPVDEEAAHL